MRLTFTYRFLFLLTLLFVVVLPYFWAYDFSLMHEVAYGDGLSYYFPEVVFSVLGLLGLIGIWQGFKYGVGFSLLVSLVIFPILKIFIGGPATDGWFVSSILMVALCGSSIRRKAKAEDA
jgi:hypothetical protein